MLTVSPREPAQRHVRRWGTLTCPGYGRWAGHRPVAGFDGVMMHPGPNLVVVTTRFTAEMEDGSTRYGSTNYPHYLPEQPR